MNLEIFFENVKYSSKFNPNSFIGKFILNGIWSDKEYWKLEKDLFKIYNKYKGKEIPREIFAGIVCISESLCISNVSEILFNKGDTIKPYHRMDFDLRERYDVLLYYLFSIYEGELNCEFDYEEK